MSTHAQFHGSNVNRSGGNEFCQAVPRCQSRSARPTQPDARQFGYDDNTIIESGVYLPELERAEASAVAVTVMWEADVLCATHVPINGSFSIGEGDDKGVGCDFFLPSELLGVHQLTLVTVHDSVANVNVPPHA